jgi:hypothetical protein
MVVAPAVVVAPPLTVVTPPVSVTAPPELLATPPTATPPVSVAAPPELVGAVGPDPFTQPTPTARSAANRQLQPRLRISKLKGMVKIELLVTYYYSNSCPRNGSLAGDRIALCLRRC